MELALIPIVAMAGTLLLSPPLPRWASDEDGRLPTGNGTSRAWPYSWVASAASASATCCCGYVLRDPRALALRSRSDKVVCSGVVGLAATSLAASE